MIDLSRLANEANQRIQDVRIGVASTSGSGDVQQVLMEYRGHTRAIRFLNEDLETHAEEWILKSLISQIVNFKLQIDSMLAS